VGLVFHWETGAYFLLDFDLLIQSFKKIELPEMEKLNDYRVALLFEGTPAGGYGPSTNVMSSNGQILISSNTFNEVQVYDLEQDSLYLKRWNTPLLADKKSYFPPKEAERTTDAFREILRKIEEDISYRPFMSDKENQRFYRFSEKMHFGDDINKFGDYMSTGSDVYLSIFDEYFKLIAESEIQELNKIPQTHFVKDGKIWMYENIDDELAFVIMDVEIL